MSPRFASPLLSRALPLLAALGLAAACKPTKSEPSDTGAVDSRDSAADDTVPVVDTTCEDSGPEATIWYRDADGDGYGIDTIETRACEGPAGYVATDGDCDDHDPTTYPGATELCDGVDNTCEGDVDEGFDADGDGYLPTDCGDDCDDGDATVYPGAEDLCGDGVDGDCAGGDPSCALVYDGDLGDAMAKLYATGRSDDAGRHMDVGDLNGDGVEDVVVGAMWADGYQGNAWVVSGPVSGTSAFSDAAVKLSGGSGSYEGGRAIGVDDVNSDGYDDVFLGSPDASAYDGVIFFGPVDDDMQFSEADVLAWCFENVECGHSGDLADINGDGVADAVIAAGEERTGGYYSGSVYILFGPLGTETVDLQSAADAELVGASISSETGRVVNAGGDLDGDGVGDILITASYDSSGGPDAGAVHVVLGPITGDEELSDSEGKLVGAAAYDYAGESHAMGDVDGDGLDDAIVGSYAASSYDGAAYVVLGPATGTVSLSSADATIHGSDGEYLGTALSSRDVNGDGTAELLAGAGNSGTAGPAAGAAYLFMGPIDGSLTHADAYATFLGEGRQDASGTGVGLGDLNGDGLLDILVGATGESTGAASAGAFYVVQSGT